MDNFAKEALDLLEKRRKYVTAKEFGAYGLSGADETASLTKALNYLDSVGGGTLYIHEGNFGVVQIRPGSNVVIEGAGKGLTTITLLGNTASAGIYSKSNSTNITIKNLTINGNKTAATRTGLINTDAHSISFAYVKKFSIENVEIINSCGASVSLFNSEQGQVINCNIINSGSNGILGLQGCKNIKVLDNYIDTTDNQNCIFFMYQEATIGIGDIANGSNQITNCTNVTQWSKRDIISGPGIPVGSYITAISGTMLTISSNATATAAKASLKTGRVSSNIVIQRNNCLNAADFGIEIGDHVKEGYSPHRFINVSFNTVVNAKNAGIAFRTVSNGQINNNEISTWGVNGGYGCDGIFVEGENNICRDVKVAANTLIQTNTQAPANGVKASDGIYVTGMRRVDIVDNTIDSPVGNGIAVVASSMTTPTPSQFPEGYRYVDTIKINQNTVEDAKINGILVACYTTDGFIKAGGNTVRRASQIGLAFANLNLSRCFDIGHNTAEKCGWDGIQVYKVYAGMVIGNTLLNNGQTGDIIDKRAGIVVTSSDDIQVGINYFNDNQTTATQTYRYSCHDNGYVYFVFNINKNDLALSQIFSNTSFHEVRYPYYQGNMLRVNAPSGSGTMLIPNVSGGLTAERPTYTAKDEFALYYDKTLNKMITWNGTGWVDFSGNSV